MFATLRRPGWAIASLAVVLLAATFIGLGLWQLDRLGERRSVNAVQESRQGMDPEPLESLIGSSDVDLDDVEYRVVTVVGEYDPSEEMLIRSQVELGQAGFHVITPLITDDGDAVLINRGWVPLVMDAPPVAASPPTGEITVTGWTHQSQTRPPLGAKEPDGDLAVLNRVDVERMAVQVPYELAPLYVVSLEEGSGELPIPVDPPDFDDEGPHLAYAIQWFGFAVVGLVGFFFLVRRKSQTGLS